MKRTITGSLIGLAVLVSSGAAMAAVVHIEGPAVVIVDGNPATVETAQFEVIVDSHALPNGSDFFGYTLGVDGLGVEFDYAATQIATDTIAADAGRDPLYLFQGDADGLTADQFLGGGPTTLEAYDGSASLTKYDPSLRPSLGIFEITITDEAAAMGFHTFTDLGESYLNGSEDLFTISEFRFEVTPEPATMSLLALGSLVLVYRRRRA